MIHRADADVLQHFAEASPETQALDGGLFCERGFSWYQEARSLVIARFVWSVAA
jgi:hypothetical protein